MFLHLDCRFYLGDRPCKFKRACEECPHYDPMGPRVLIIKYGALGDVVRTACLLPGLERLVGSPAHVTWLTSAPAEDLVRRMPGVDRVLVSGTPAVNQLNVEHFDLVICLEKEPEPCSIAMTVQADSKRGVGLSRYGTPYPLSEHADYYFALGLDDDEKFFKNEKTYQQLVYEAIDLEYQGERYEIELTDEDRAAAERRFSSFEAPSSVRRWVGLNPGAGDVFAFKAWREDGYVALIREVAERCADVGFVLLGGPGEAALLDRIDEATAGSPVFNAGTDNSLGAFAAIIDRCDALVCGDTLAMHLAVARRVRAVVMFGPTCEQEVDLFGLGRKIKTPIECSPCYRRSCDVNPSCQDLITNKEVIDAVVEELEACAAARRGSGQNRIVATDRPASKPKGLPHHE